MLLWVKDDKTELKYFPQILLSTSFSKKKKEVNCKKLASFNSLQVSFSQFKPNRVSLSALLRSPVKTLRRVLADTFSVLLSQNG